MAMRVVSVLGICMIVMAALSNNTSTRQRCMDVLDVWAVQGR